MQGSHDLLSVVAAVVDKQNAESTSDDLSFAIGLLTSHAREIAKDIDSAKLNGTLDEAAAKEVAIGVQQCATHLDKACQASAPNRKPGSKPVVNVGPALFYTIELVARLGLDTEELEGAMTTNFIDSLGPKLDDSGRPMNGLTLVAPLPGRQAPRSTRAPRDARCTAHLPL